MIQVDIDIQETENQLLLLLERAANGEEIILFKNHEPFVKLLPIDPTSKPRQRQFGSAKGLIVMAEDFDDPLPDFEAYQ